MEGKAEIEAGICGHRTICRAKCEDGQNVTFEIESDCEKIQNFAAALTNKGPLDAYQEINAKGGRSVVLAAAAESLKGCCAACAAPIGVFKAMQVAAGLALPKDIRIVMSKK